MNRLNICIMHQIGAHLSGHADQGVHHIGCLIGSREGPVAPFYHGAQAVGREQRDQGLGRQVIESRPQDIGIGTDVAGEVVPGLDIGKVAAPFPGNHDFPARTGHFFQYRYLGGLSCAEKRATRPIGRHQPGGTAANDQDIRNHGAKIRKNCRISGKYSYICSPVTRERSRPL